MPSEPATDRMKPPYPVAQTVPPPPPKTSPTTSSPTSSPVEKKQPLPETRRKLSKTVTNIDPWRPDASEAAEINKLIAASKDRTASAVLRERRKSISKELEPKPSGVPSPTGQVLPSPKGDAISSAVAASPMVAPGPLAAKVPAAGNKAMARWKNAGVAVAVAAKSSESERADDDDTDSTQAKLYRLLSQNISSQNLSGAAARGARAAAEGRVKAASKAVGGRFLSADEWEAMRFEMAELRLKNKRLTQDIAALRHQALSAKESADRDASSADAPQAFNLWKAVGFSGSPSGRASGRVSSSASFSPSLVRRPPAPVAVACT